MQIWQERSKHQWNLDISWLEQFGINAIEIQPKPETIQKQINHKKINMIKTNDRKYHKPKTYYYDYDYNKKPINPWDDEEKMTIFREHNKE